MCGITGILHLNHSQDTLMNKVREMNRTIHYRGPDDEGFFTDKECPSIVLGHRRLSIIDPAHGQQPMTSQEGRYTVVFNGAIYNYLELRRDLISAGHPIVSYSDTEVILYAYAQWKEDCVKYFNGMFAFALWDRVEKKLFCARDRVGIKPFYFYHEQDRFVFASEIKAILASGEYKKNVNYEALQDYITFQFCLNGKTLFKNIHALLPGHTLTITFDSSIHLKEKKYWDIPYALDDRHDESYFIEKLSFLLEASINEHLRSDVPLGAHLSGGLDSSAVVGIASKLLGSSSLKTFTGAFKEGPAFDETAYAKKMAHHAGATYHELFISNEELPSLLPKLVYHMDEPAAGPGLIPQYYVSQLASKHVKVVLGGQGGDELYIGYARYLVAYLEQCLKNSIFPSEEKTKGDLTLQDITPHLSSLKSYGPMLQHLWREGLFHTSDQRYFRLMDRSEGTCELFNLSFFNEYSTFNEFQYLFNHPSLTSLINQMTHFDLKASLPALLHVEDRTSMAHSIESRVPLLDHRLIEFMASIPPSIKFSKGKTKHLFREAVSNFIPSEVLHRTDKMGFPVPLNHWIDEGLNSFVQDILFSQAARERGIYDLEKIKETLNHTGTFSRVIWGLLNVELWHQVFMDETIRF